MDLLTARPEKLFGSVAFASVAASVPVGLLFALYGLATHPFASPDTWKASLGSVLLAPVLIFVAGVLLLPILFLLRRVGYAGPFCVYALSSLCSVVVLGSDAGAGLLSLALSLPASYVLCRHAYS